MTGVNADSDQFHVDFKEAETSVALGTLGGIFKAGPGS